MVDTNKKTYGSLEEGNNNNNEFDEKNTYYLSESGFNWRTFGRAAIPIVIALIIMGGFSYGMGHGFNHFYGPPRGGLDKDKEDDNNIISDEPIVPRQSTVIEHGNDTTKDKKSSGSSDAQCSKHDKCAALGLTGLCCPTQKDTMLECC